MHVRDFLGPYGYRHKTHAIVVKGQFDFEALSERWIEVLDGTFKSGFRNATRWKDGRLFGELLEHKVELAKSLLAKAREVPLTDHPLDGPIASRALEVAGWVKKEPSC